MTDAADALAATMAPGPQVDSVRTAPQPELGDGPSMQIGNRIGRYVILRQIGQGGMGLVFATYDEELDRKVAVKVLREAGPISSERKARILREAQAMARVSHPNVVNVYEVGEVHGQVYIAMELVEGMTLTEWQRGERTWEQVLAMYVAAGNGLAAAHRAGLTHRDFKPDNVLVGSDGRPRVADFGLARSEAGPELPSAPRHNGDAAQPTDSQPTHLLASPLTMAGTILGTPAYMSPEQHLGKPTDGRSDQFSFCVSLYEALFKTLPFAGDTLSALAKNTLAGKVRPTPHPSPIPNQIDRALRRGLLADPARRWDNMAALLSELDIDPDIDPAGAPRSRRMFTALITCAVIASGLLLHSGGTAMQLTHTKLLMVSVGIFTVIGGAAWKLRRTLLQNAFHRGIVKLLLVFVAQLAVLRGFSMIIGLSMDQVLPLDTLVMTGMGAAIAALFLPLAWPLVGASLALATAEAFHPAHMELVAALYYPAMTITLVLLWSRAAGDRARWDAEHRPICSPKK